ncbi:MAG: N,N'-diacetyllegionaminate synthase [Bacteroidia bacterium]|jgi:N,N'-diacetyllegionaminate synthase
MNTWKGKHGPILIAEIGGNHEGDFDYALRLTDLAIQADVDFVKFQMYSGDSLVSREESPTRNAHFKKFELSQDQYIELAKRCEMNNVKFMASVWNPEYFKWIDAHQSVYKIGSGDLTAYPVLKATAALNKPMIISTGLSLEAEVLDAIAYIQSCNPLYKDSNHLSVLQCTSMYPIPMEDANLFVMQRLHQLTGLPVGYSDHTEGSKALEIAFAMGAQILEFHFTDSREGKEFRDHKVSLTRDEVVQLIHDIKVISSLQGSTVKEPLPIEGDHVTTFRRAVYPVTDLKRGTVIKETHLITLRPNHGIDARNFHTLIGKSLKQDVRAHQKLDVDMFE